jgi:hypothetical protein
MGEKITYSKELIYVEKWMMIVTDSEAITVVFGATIIKSLLIELYIQGFEGLVLYTVVLGFELKKIVYVFRISEFIFFIFLSCYITLGFH